jgi:uncharacterized repeat protein (TIGR01451 family)
MSTPPHRLLRRPLTIAPLVAGCLALAAAPALGGPPAPKPKTPATDLAIAKSAAEGSYAPGETIAWTITVANVGAASVPAADVVVTDPQLADLAPVGGGTAGDQLAPGETLTWSGTQVASAADCGVLSNTATVALRGRKKGEGDGNPANDSATASVDVSGEGCARQIAVSVLAQPAPAPAPSTTREAMPQARRDICPRPRLSARVTGPAKLVAGEAARFTIAVRNAAGAPAARRARLTVKLPLGFALATPAKASAIGDGAVRMSLGTLPARRSRSISVALRADRTTSGGQALRASVSARCGTARAKALVRVARAVENQVLPPVTG